MNLNIKKAISIAFLDAKKGRQVSLKNIFNKLLKSSIVFFMTFTSIYSTNLPVNALTTSVTGDQIIAKAQTFSNWSYYDVGTCTGLVTRVLDALGIGDAVVGSMVGSSAQFTPDKMYANAIAHPEAAELIWEGKVKNINSAASLLENGDLVIQKADDKYIYDGFGHVGFIHIYGSTISMYGANNEEDGIGDAVLTTNARGTPITVHNENKIKIFRLVEDTQYGNLKITKQNEDGVKVANTSFKLSHNSDMSSPIGTYTTGADGTITIPKIEAKTVYVQETSVPDDLVLDDTIQPVTIPANGTATHTATNTFKKGHLEISKQDEDGTYVPNTSFSLSYNADMSSPLGAYTTGANGKVLVENLRARKVYVQEISVPDPLILDNTIRSVTVLYNQTVAYNASNIYKTGNLEIQKLDIDTGNPVKRAGAEFEVYKSDGTYVATTSTNALGVARLNSIRYGDYYFLEKTPPQYYTKSSTRVNFQIRENGVTIKKSYSNKRTLGTIELTKVDKETGLTPQGDAKLDGALYTVSAKKNILSPDDGHVIHSAGKQIATLRIENNKAKIENLYLGEYTIKEVQAGTGYLIDPKSYDINITYTSPDKTVEMRATTSTEQVKKRAFELIKIASDGESGDTPTVAGARFTVKLESEVKKVGWENAKVYDELVSDNKGYAKSIELPYGKYRIRETFTPPNLSPVDDFFVNVENDSRVPIKWTVQNDVPYVTLIGVVKLDSETGDIVRLEGAKFKIWNIDEEKYEGWWQWNPIPTYIDTFTTNEDGNVITPGTVRAGHYKLIEVESPEGYLLNKESKPFTITEDGPHQIGPDGTHYITNITFSDTPAKGQLVLEKTAELFQNYEAKETEFGTLYQPVYREGLLAGVSYEIRAREDIMSADGTRMYYAKGTLIETLKTNGNTATKSSRLPLGAYTVQEVGCDDPSYVIDSNIYEFDLIYKDQETPTVTQTMRPFNERQTGNATIIKNIEESDMSDNSEAYKDVRFGVFTASELQVNGNKALDADKMIQVVSLDEALQGNIYVDYEGKYYLKELATDDQYVLSDEKYPFNFAYAGDKETVLEINGGNPIYNYVKRGNVKIHKIDGLTDKPLVNVRYELATDEAFEHIVKETSTDEKGNAIFEELEKGTYYLREKYDGVHDMVMEGYVKDPTIHEIVIEEHEQIIELSFENIPVRGQVTFTKKGETFNNVDVVDGEYGTEYHPRWEETTLLGSELTIYAAEDITTWDGIKWYEKDEAVFTLESDWDTVDSLTLPVGKYYAKETKVPHGYVCDTSIYNFEIEKNGSAEIQVNPITIYNNRAVVTINLKKAMEEQATFVNPDAYKEVVYGLYAREGIYDYMGNVAIEPDSLIGTSTIDADGNLTSIYDLPIGTYYFKELKTNDQYVLDTKEYDFEVGYQGQDVVEFTIDINQGETIHNYLKRGSVEIMKTDKESTKPLLNVHFELATDEAFTNILKETATGEDGKAIFEELEKGAYYIREQYDNEHDMVIEGYVKDETIHKVEVKEDKEIIEIDMENQPIKGNVTFDKTGETFNDVEIIEGAYGKEYHPIWKGTALLGSILTIEATEDITTWDGTQWYKKGEIVTTIESDWESSESIMLPVGKYVAYESQTPHGYITDPSRYEFEVTPNGKADIQINPISIFNERANVNMDFTKSLEEATIFKNEEAYKDVVFGLYAREGVYDYMGNVLIVPDSLVGISNIDEKGHLTSTYDLPNGTYYFKELVTNEQFILDKTEYDFEIGYQGADVTEYTVDINDGKEIENKLIHGSIEINKITHDTVHYDALEQAYVDSFGKLNNSILRNDLLKDEVNYLTGVEFQLATDKEFKNVIRTGKTDITGRLLFEELERGTYYIRESKHLEAYKVNSDVFEVTIEKDGQFEILNVDNTLIESFALIKKVDEADTSRLLAGAEFTLYSDAECTKEIDKQTTQADGLVLFKNIKFGETVYAKETKAPSGYELDSSVHEIRIDYEWIKDTSNETRTIQITNKQTPPVNTGDHVDTGMYLMAFVVSSGALLGFAKRKRTKKSK